RRVLVRVVAFTIRSSKDDDIPCVWSRVTGCGQIDRVRSPSTGRGGGGWRPLRGEETPRWTRPPVEAEEAGRRLRWGRGKSVETRRSGTQAASSQPHLWRQLDAQADAVEVCDAWKAAARKGGTARRGQA
ncbi:unnamed protein product, partial [Lampetra fluviatilis]